MDKIHVIFGSTTGMTEAVAALLITHDLELISLVADCQLEIKQS